MSHTSKLRNGGDFEHYPVIVEEASQLFAEAVALKDPEASRLVWEALGFGFRQGFVAAREEIGARVGDALTDADVLSPYWIEEDGGHVHLATSERPDRRTAEASTTEALS